MSDPAGNHRFDVPPPRDNYIRFKTPTKMDNVPSMTDEQAEILISTTVDDAMFNAAGKLQKTIPSMDPESVEKLTEEAANFNTDPATYLQEKLTLIGTCYTAMRTSLLEFTDSDAGYERNITPGVISNELTTIADLIGPNLTKQLYETLAAEIDNVLVDNFGKEHGI